MQTQKKVSTVSVNIVKKLKLQEMTLSQTYEQPLWQWLLY